MAECELCLPAAARHRQRSPKPTEWAVAVGDVGGIHPGASYLSIWVRVEVMGSQNCRIVRKSQSVLMMINPIIFTRTRTVQLACCPGTASLGPRVGTHTSGGCGRLPHSARRRGGRDARCVRRTPRALPPVAVSRALMRFLLTENYLCHTFLSVNDEDEHASAGSASSAARAALSRPRQRAEPQRTPAGSSGGGTPHHSAEPALPQPACLGSGGGGSDGRSQPMQSMASTPTQSVESPPGFLPGFSPRISPRPAPGSHRAASHMGGVGDSAAAGVGAVGSSLAEQIQESSIASLSTSPLLDTDVATPTDMTASSADAAASGMYLCLPCPVLRCKN
eukprot:COSAG01_NODE_2478_length_7613_cov_477.283737_4_plen_335_part_00